MVHEAKNDYVLKAKQFIQNRPPGSWVAFMNTKDGKVEFARSVAAHCKCPLLEKYEEDPDGLLRHIDAYWKFRCSMLDLHGYNFEKHKNDFYDAHQLIYLADPALYLVIDDRPFVCKIPASDQRSRILSTDEFFSRIRAD